MSEKRERKAFDRRYESAHINIVVLTGSIGSGATHFRGESLWSPSIDVIAHVDETGAIVSEEGVLYWLATGEQRGTWIHDLKPLTQYVVRVRRAISDPVARKKLGLPVPNTAHHFALEQVIERDVHVPALDERMERWLQPNTISRDFGSFTLDRAFECFIGDLHRDDSAIGVSLDVDEGSVEGAETCTVALSYLTELVAALPRVEASWRAFAATKLTGLANDWQQEDDSEPAPEPITADTFARRIRLSELAINDEGLITTYFDDGEMFGGHSITFYVEPDGTMTDAHLAG
ncbi:DUF2262 domain-containing protein [Leucobacter viscericola]|uniref:DUF2262 domain-containing protein n=1 Tax=Leucobacter viscericola TaxID=2714935 RepID=A0A6G7XGP6_9MICO|nr:DUF2262 domain-containing protein [Leucobacter viscericola]QIK63780.1 DUF2262 domain-containing protein [Leucobacter viscericola]